MKKLDFCSIMQQSSFKFNFQKNIFIYKNDMKRIQNKLNSNKLNLMEQLK